MPNIKSAIKRVKISERNRVRNTAVKSSIRTAMRKLKDRATAGDSPEQLKELLARCYKTIDKAVTKGVLHKNTAARRKARVANLYNKTVNK